MQRKITVGGIIALLCIMAYSFTGTTETALYESAYRSQLTALSERLDALHDHIAGADPDNPTQRDQIRLAIREARRQLKKTDFWLRYLDPLQYKKLNGPLPVEWETEVFEKFEKPYKREGAGLTLAWLYLEEQKPERDELLRLIEESRLATRGYYHDSVAGNLKTFDHFYFCNRLYLLNLAAIYTTGFECPDTESVIPELLLTMQGAADIYESYNRSFPATKLSESFTDLHRKAIAFVATQPTDYTRFNHFVFLRDYVNPMFGMNQQLMQQYGALSKSTMDYALNKQAPSIFNKALYEGQNSKGIYYNVSDEKVLASIDKLGKLLFYDPILSGNNERSCASCHKPTQFFTDTMQATSPQFDRKGALPRNTPSLINVNYNHLAMLDGAHISLQDQARSVMLSQLEMGGNEQEIVDKVQSCDQYKKAFVRLLSYTPQRPQLSFDHIISALTVYYTKFSNASAPFDRAMEKQQVLSEDAIAGFNLFMSKAQCATCHFVPQFNGVKPPFIGSEFEVLGTPATADYKGISPDKGRYGVNPASETLHAFRTGSLRNIMHTAPYMHNGVFRTITEVIDFYDGGGGAGHGLQVSNQTLSSDSLHLTAREKQQLIAFLTSLDEEVPFEPTPAKLPPSANKALNNRVVGGLY